MAFLARFKFWIALALPVLIAVGTFFLGFRRMARENDANLAKAAKIRSELRQLGQSADIPPRDWEETYDGIMPEYQGQKASIESIMDRPPVAVGVGDIIDWDRFLAAVAKPSTPGTFAIWSASAAGEGRSAYCACVVWSVSASSTCTGAAWVAA